MIDLNGSNDLSQTSIICRAERREGCEALPAASRSASPDCTLGRYTIQNRSGVLLRDPPALAGAPVKGLAVRPESVTGYGHLFPWEETQVILLAKHTGGEPLAHE